MKLKDQWTTTREVKAIAGGHKMWLTEGYDGYGGTSVILGLQYDPSLGASGWVTVHLNVGWDTARVVANAINRAYHRGVRAGVDPLRRAALAVSDAGWLALGDIQNEGMDESEVLYGLGLAYTNEPNNRDEARTYAAGQWGEQLVEAVISESRSRYLNAEYAAGLG